MHGIKAKKSYKSESHLSLRGWYERKRKQRIDAHIRDILDIHHTAETANIPKNHTLPPIWSHKTEVLTGDTVYLAHDNYIRSFILSGMDQATPEEGRVSIVSPIGRKLLGKHQGDKVHLRTLDGDADYTILKIL